MPDRTEIAAQYWNKVAREAAVRPFPLKWWEEPRIIRHINARVCGEPIDGFNSGFIRRLKERISGLPLRRGVSVGCGDGRKELNYIKQGIVDKFELFEIAEERVRQGEQIYLKTGYQDCVKFSMQNPFEGSWEARYDLVVWDNALHHMFNVDEALQWSRAVLNPGGWLIMNDFVGPTRFQWTDRNLEYVNRIRKLLPEKYFTDPYDPSKQLARELGRHRIENMMKVDPSEAADSSNIVPALRKYFPNVDIQFTGGAIYNLALSGVLYNLASSEDSWLLDTFLAIDDLLSELGENHYALAFGKKE